MPVRRQDHHDQEPAPRRRVLRWIAVGAVVVVVGAGGVALWLATRPAPTESGYTLVQVTAQTLRQTVGTTGTLQPAERADLSFATSGTITDVAVKIGDTVRKSQKLATLDDSALQANLDAAKAQLEAAKDQLANAEDGDATQADIDAAKANAALQKSKVDQAKSQLAEATLSSPIAGTVAAVNIAAGDNVSGQTGSGGSSGQGSQSSSNSSAQITVISTDAYVVDSSVTSSDLASIKKGLQAEITPAGDTQTVSGTVASVGVMASSSGSSSSAGAATFPVSIEVTGKPAGLYPGSSVTVSIIVKEITNALTVPTAALSVADGQTVVHQLKDGQRIATPVQVGESYGATTHVLSGLKAGDQVMIDTPGRARNASGGNPGSAPSTEQRERRGAGGFGGEGFGGSGFGAGGFGGSGGAGAGRFGSGSGGAPNSGEGGSR